MTRAERYAQCKALRDEGLLLREIAERVGVATQTVHDVLSDPTGEKRRERMRQYERSCVGCGKTINPNGPRVDTARCRKCQGERERAMTRAWIVDSFREWEERFGVPPTASDWNPQQAAAMGRLDKVQRHAETGRPWPAPPTVIAIFGSWNEGRAAAGFETFGVGKYGRDGEDPAILAETARLYDSGLSLGAVGELMGVSGSCVRDRLISLGVPRRPAGRPAQVAA